MARGGARNRSGPQPDPNSGRSDRRNLQFAALDPDGYDGDAPEWPLAKPQVDIDIHDAEQSAWADAWTTPQAIAWADEPWRWPIIAEYCRIKATVEVNPGASAALVSQLHRYRDQIGFTPAGLRENGWQIGKPPAKSEDEPRAAAATGSRDRLKVIQGDAAAG